MHYEEIYITNYDSYNAINVKGTRDETVLYLQYRQL